MSRTTKPTMTLPFLAIDVFTKTPFRGNLLGIVHARADTELAQDQKQLRVRELNLSETVFLYEQTAADIPFAGNGVANYLPHDLPSRIISISAASRLPGGYTGHIPSLAS
ncbi:hypothetical protein F5Y11DRAFT_283278 [Daldinia sp. FL1419]|nr:hypothetical protein F5Y11DRAFT_283278 [Daldinia sp. FL1419]